MIGLRHVLSAALLLVSAAGLKAGPAAANDTATPAVTSTEIERHPAGRGDRAPPRHLCDLYFDGRADAFDAAKAADSCRRAADAGNRAAMHRLGLLSLAGLGVPRDVVAAARLCSGSPPSDPDPSASFCRAAAEAQREGLPTPPDRPVARQPDANGARAIRQWRDLAGRGDRAAAGHLCETYFGTQPALFDPAGAVLWCRRAAGFGDARAMLRLGLMRLWGVGVEKDGSQAEALCREAASRDPAISPAFCIAAARQERARNAAGAAARTASRQNLGSGSSLAQARILETVHTTTTGLTYRCRDFTRWSRYETADGLGVLTPDAPAFGKRIGQLGPKDYPALDTAAAECATALTAYDNDGSERRGLAEFQRLLPLIAARQSGFGEQTRERQAEIQRCASAIGSAWKMHGDSPGATLSETSFCTPGGRAVRASPEKPSGMAPPRPSAAGQ